MGDDNVFRIGMLAICLAFMPIGLYYRIWSYTGEKIDRWQEGVFILFGLRLTALVVVAAGIAWMTNPQWMAWASLPLPSWLRWIAVAVAVSGGCLWVWAVHSLGKNLTDTVVTRQDHTLVTDGPYRWIRHPFYTACAIGLVGGSVVMANWFFPLAAAIVWIAFLVPRTRIEEANLAARFGDQYREYMRQTGRYLPRFRS
jgi:protein-S-isoprenylcysteine O-methyltransferase Ste14